MSSSVKQEKKGSDVWSEKRRGIVIAVIGCIVLLVASVAWYVKAGVIQDQVTAVLDHHGKQVQSIKIGDQEFAVHGKLFADLISIEKSGFPLHPGVEVSFKLSIKGGGLSNIDMKVESARIQSKLVSLNKISFIFPETLNANLTDAKGVPYKFHMENDFAMFRVIGFPGKDLAMSPEGKIIASNLQMSFSNGDAVDKVSVKDFSVDLFNGGDTQKIEFSFVDPVIKRAEQTEPFAFKRFAFIFRTENQLDTTDSEFQMLAAKFSGAPGNTVVWHKIIQKLSDSKMNANFDLKLEADQGSSISVSAYASPAPSVSRDMNANLRLSVIDPGVVFGKLVSLGVLPEQTSDAYLKLLRAFAAGAKVPDKERFEIVADYSEGHVKVNGHDIINMVVN